MGLYRAARHGPAPVFGSGRSSRNSRISLHLLLPPTSRGAEGILSIRLCVRPRTAGLAVPLGRRSEVSPARAPPCLMGLYRATRHGPAPVFGSGRSSRNSRIFLHLSSPHFSWGGGYTGPPGWRTRFAFDFPRAPWGAPSSFRGLVSSPPTRSAFGTRAGGILLESHSSPSTPIPPHAPRGATGRPSEKRSAGQGVGCGANPFGLALWPGPSGLWTGGTFWGIQEFYARIVGVASATSQQDIQCCQTHGKLEKHVTGFGGKCTPNVPKSGSCYRRTPRVWPPNSQARRSRC